MSQKNEGLLNEEEVKTYLNEAFNLKLTRDVLVNPRKEIVMDLYTRFLDYRKSNWRRVRNPKAVSLAIMVKRLRVMLQVYVPGDKREFHFGDLVAPDRRRTNFFLNALLFIKAQVDDAYQDWQQWDTEWKSNKEIAQELDRELEEARKELEHLAVKKSQAKSADELREEIRRKKALVDDFESRYNETEREKEQTKLSLQTLAERRKELESIKASLREQNQQKEQTLHMLDNGKGIKILISDLEQSKQKLDEKIQSVEERNENFRLKVAEVEKFVSLDNLDKDGWPKEKDHTKALISKLVKRRTMLETAKKQLIDNRVTYKSEENASKDRISDIDAAIYKLSMQNKISEMQAQASLKEAESARKKEIQQYADEISRLNETLNNIDKKLIKLEEERNKAKEQHKDYVGQLEHKCNSAFESYQSWTKSDQKIITELQNVEKRINDIMGTPQMIPPKIISPQISAPPIIAQQINVPQINASLINHDPTADQSLPANRTYLVN